MSWDDPVEISLYGPAKIRPSQIRPWRPNALSSIGPMMPCSGSPIPVLSLRALMISKVYQVELDASLSGQRGRPEWMCGKLWTPISCVKRQPSKRDILFPEHLFCIAPWSACRAGKNCSPSAMKNIPELDAQFVRDQRGATGR